MDATTTRRSFLGRAAVLLGALGLGFVPHRLSVPSARTATTRNLDFRARHLHYYSQDRKRGERPLRGDQVVGHSELVNSDSGATGTFYSSCVFVHSPSRTETGASDLQFHTFVLEDGMIFGAGATPAGRLGRAEYAVVGGTGQYASLRGTYTAELSPEELGGDGTGRFAFKISG